MPSHPDILLDSSSMMFDKIGEAGVEKELIDSTLPQIKEMCAGLRDLRRLGQLPFQDLPYHEDLTREIQEKAKKVRDQFESVLVLGMGGSALGAKFLVSCFKSERQSPKVIICDSVDPITWRNIADRLDFKKTLLLVVSKSGRTVETLAATIFFKNLIKEQVGPNCQKHLFFITDPREGPLRKLAEQEGAESFSISPGVGGRFSVLTPAGLFPAACAGVDIAELLQGACRMDQKCQPDDPWLNPALMSSLLHYLFDIIKKRKIRVLMPYGDQLAHFSPWFAQLWSESLGKRYSLKGKEIFSGTTPVCALGPQDQHSQLQLYLEGPQDKTVTFIGAEKTKEDIEMSKTCSEIKEISFLAGKSAHHLLIAEMLATEEALREARRPHQRILLREVTPHAIGQLLFMSEMEAVYAGGLYNVNPFDQPAVESIKRHIPGFLK